MIGRVDSRYNQRLSPPRDWLVRFLLILFLFKTSSFLFSFVYKMKVMVQKPHTFMKLTKANDVCDGSDSLISALVFLGVEFLNIIQK